MESVMKGCEGNESVMNSAVSAERVSLQVPVTAAAFFKGDLVLTGCGNEVDVFDVRLKRKVSQAAILPFGVNISGFNVCKTDSSCFLAHGDRFLAFSGVSHDGDGGQATRICTEGTLEMHDWIVHASFLSSTSLVRDERSSIAVLTAHNQLVILDAETKAKVWESHCQDQSVIICGRVVQSANGIFVVTGTMFSEVLLWIPRAEGPAAVVHRLKGHAGVLFSVDLNSAHSSIVSASDDRAVCVWHVKNPDIAMSHPAQAFERVGPLHGHDARVWRASFLPNHAGIDPMVVSVGEDSKVCIWSATDGQLKKTFIAHGGASIWCLAVSEWHHSVAGQSFITGGADGAAKLFTTWRDEPKIQIPTLDSKEDQIRSVHCINTCGSKLLLAYVSGRLCIACSPDGSVELSLDESDLLKSYSCLDILIASPGEHGHKFQLAASGLAGAILVFQFTKNAGSSWDVERKIFKLEKELMGDGGSKVCFIKWLAEDSVLVSTASGSSSVLANLDDCPSFSSLPQKDSIGQRGEKWITAAAMSSCGKFLVAGYRNGEVRMFNEASNLEEGGEGWTQLGPTPTNVFGKRGVTCVRFDQEKGVFWGAGRNGIICAWKSSSKGLHLLEKIDWKHEWIGGIIFHKGDMGILSFHSRMCVVQNQRGDELMRVDCGGGHRSWDLAVENAENSAVTRFYFIKDGALYLESVSSSCLSSPVVLKEPGAKTTINTATVLTSNLLVLGAEDGTVSFVSLDSETSTFRSVGRPLSHLSSVKAVAVAQEDADSFLLAFGGGRALVVLYRLFVSDCQPRREVYSTKLAEIYAAAGDPLRSTKRKPWLSNNNTTIISSECRINSLHFPNEDSLLAGCSDGFIRSYRLKGGERVMEVELLWETELEPCAVTRCLALPSGASLNDDEGVLCSGSDGIIRVFSDRKNVLEWMAHPAGVSCLDVAAASLSPASEAKDCAWMVASGGDDSAVCLSLLGTEKECSDGTSAPQQWTLMCTAKNAASIACQIAGVKLLPEDNMVVSCSLNQQVTFWFYKILDTSGSINLEPLQSVMTNVADIHQLVTIRREEADNSRTAEIVVVGCGMEWIRCLLDI